MINSEVFRFLRGLVLISIVLVIVLVAKGVRAETSVPSDAKAWLAAARSAMGELNYRGMITYLKDSQVESLKVIHGVNDGIEQERLLSVNTPMREIIRNADKVTCYFPETRSMMVESKLSRHSYLFDLPSNLTELTKYYGFMLGGTEYVAQRPARLITIEPLDEFRYGRKLWLDVESKLPLKYELIDDQGQVVEQMVFNTLTVEASIPPEDLKPSTRVDDSWKIKQHELLPAESLRWTLNNVPEGFRMMSYTRLLKRGSDNRAIDHILLSDGFSSVSIYIDQLMNEGFTSQPKKFGAIHSYTRKMDKYLLTVMGEVPEVAVQTIGNGIRQQSTQHQ